MEVINGTVKDIKSSYDELRKLNKRQALLQGVNLGTPHRLAIVVFKGILDSSCSTAGLIVTSALMIWKTLILLTGSESPVRHAIALIISVCITSSETVISVCVIVWFAQV